MARVSKWLLRQWPTVVAMTVFLSSTCSLASADPSSRKAPTPAVSHPISSEFPSADSVVLGQTRVDGIPMVSTPASVPAPSIVAQSAVVMDMTTGTVVYAKNPQVPHYPASLTKIMTAILALKYGHLSDMLTTHVDATLVPPDKLYLVPGEKEPLRKLLYGLLLISANDAAVVIADHYGGSVAGFAKMMNQEAKSLGAVHTHFVNPNGLPNPYHVTTAYDLALISRHAMENPIFRQIVRTKYYQWKGEAWSSDLMNINNMLFTYPGDIGIKTGFTNAAHETLAVAATHGKETFLAILMDAPLLGQINQDGTNLLNYAFANYKTVTIVQNGQPEGYAPTKTGTRIPLKASESVVFTTALHEPTAHYSFLAKKKPITHSISAGVRIGTLDVLRNGQVVASVPLSAAASWRAPLPPSPKHDGDIVWLLLVIAFIGWMLGYNKRHQRTSRPWVEVDRTWASSAWRHRVEWRDEYSHRK